MTAFVGPPRRRGRGAWDAAICSAAALALALAGLAGILGQDFRWLGGLALGEVTLTRGMWWSGALCGRRWTRLGLRLTVSALALGVLGIAMPDASSVGWAYMLGALAALMWLGLLVLVGPGHARAGESAATVAVMGVLGLWFAAVGVPSSGWAAAVTILTGARAFEWAATLERGGAP